MGECAMSRLRTVYGTFCAAALAAAASDARGVVIADWRFEPDAFTVDSSGNGHTLTSTGATSSGETPGAFSTGSASFVGNDFLQTVAALDLSGYESLTVT